MRADFAAAMRQVGLEATDGESRALFRVYDAENTGGITVEALEKALRQGASRSRSPKDDGVAEASSSRRSARRSALATEPTAAEAPARTCPLPFPRAPCPLAHRTSSNRESERSGYAHAPASRGVQPACAALRQHHQI